MPTSLGGISVPIDYSTRDYEGFRQDALDLAALLTPEWTDFFPTDLGVVLVEAFAYMSDINSYYLDRAANECFLPTATQRRSVINLGRLVGYELSPATSAIVSMLFTTTAAGTISQGEQVSTDPAETGEDAVVYEVISDTVVVGAGTYTLDCIQGTSVSNEVLGSGNGLATQQFSLAQAPLSLDPSGVSSLRVYIDEGSGFVLYTEVTNFVGSGTTDRHYTVRIDESDNVEITFGDGVNGRVIAGGLDNVQASYRVGGGAFGNSVGKGKITKYLSGNTIVDVVTNGDNTPQGGDDKESVEDAKANIPGIVRALDRAVTLADYEALTVAGVGGIRQARATQGIGPFEVVVYVAAEGANPVASGTWDPVLESGTGLVGQVGAYLAVRKSAPIKLVVRPPTAVPLSIEFALEVNEGFFRVDVSSQVTDALLGFVEATARMGENLYLSDVLGELESLAGVKNVRVTLYRRKPTQVLEKPDPFYVGGTPDTVWTMTTTDDDDHALFAMSSSVQATLQEALHVKFVTATTYRVTGAQTGVQSARGTVGSLWTNDLGNVTLRAVAGGVPNYAGNEYRLSVGSGVLVAYVEVAAREIITLEEEDIVVSSLVGGIT